MADNYNRADAHPLAPKPQCTLEKENGVREGTLGS